MGCLEFDIIFLLIKLTIERLKYYLPSSKWTFLPQVPRWYHEADRSWSGLDKHGGEFIVLSDYEVEWLKQIMGTENRSIVNYNHSCINV